MKPCPDCGAPTELIRGAIYDAVMTTGTGAIEHRARPAVYYACTECEHCEEK